MFNFLGLCYVTLFMIDEISFAEYSRFVKSCPLKESVIFLGFVFSRENIQLMTLQWNSILDHVWVEDHLASKLSRHLDDAQGLLDLLISREEGAVKLKKSVKPTGGEFLSFLFPCFRSRAILFDKAESKKTGKTTRIDIYKIQSKTGAKKQLHRHGRAGSPSKEA